MSSANVEVRLETSWVSTSAGRHLSGRRSRDTEPELLLRRALHARGLRFRLQRRLAKACTPDVVLPGRRLAVFVDGCWWHSCPKHGRKTPFSGPNAQLWAEKMERIQARDRRADELCRKAGWIPVRIWECDIRSDVTGCVNRIVTADDV